MALCQAPLQTTGISPVKRYDPLQGSSGVQTPNLQALHVVRRIFIFIYRVAGTVLAENTQKPLLLQTSPKKTTRMREKHRGSAMMWRKFQGNTQPGTSSCKNPNLQHPLPSSPLPFLTSWESSYFD